MIRLIVDTKNTDKNITVPICIFFVYQQEIILTKANIAACN